jgi:uroporphyrinogen decarboxylase
MNPRERFLTILAHREPDKVPVDLGKHIGSIHRSGYLRLREHLSLTTNVKVEILNYMAQTVVPHEDLLERLGIDFRWLVPKEIGRREVNHEAYYDMWGILFKYNEHGNYYAVWESPLRNAAVSDIEDYPWPDPDNIEMFEELHAVAQELDGNTEYIVGADAIQGGILTTALWLRGYDTLFMDFALNSDFVDRLLDKLLYLYKRMWNNYMRLVGPFVQVVYLTDDLGTQTSLLISPEMFRRFIKPRLKDLIEHIKSMASVKVMFHSDGSILPLLEDLIEIGVDILNPVQTALDCFEATDTLKERYGDYLCFHGAIDVQQKLPAYTPEELRAEVHRRIHDLAPDGGFILAPCHNIGPDVPPENTVAVFDAARVHGTYPLR